MRCPQCQTDLPDGAKFCKECGQKIRAYPWLVLEGFSGKVMENQKRLKSVFDEGLSISKGIKLKSWYSQGGMFIGEFYLDVSQKEKAQEHLNEAEALFQEMGMDYWLGRTRTLLTKIV
jgi:hypothetical protein